MKLWILLVLCAVAAAAPSLPENELMLRPNDEVITNENRNNLLNILIRQLFVYLRYVIKNGSAEIAPLDPFVLEEFHYYLPAGIVNMDLHLRNGIVIGLGDFVVHQSHVINLSDLSFQVEISVPKFDITADMYDFTGNLYNAIPLYGKGRAHFVMENFKFRCVMYVKQSPDGRAILVDRIEAGTLVIPSFKSDMTGIIGGGDIDLIVNAIIEDVVIDYVNRFQVAIAKSVFDAIIVISNPILERLDTWKFLDPFVRS